MRYKYAILLGLCFVAVHITLFAVFGIRELYDSVLYVQGAEYWIDHGALQDNQQIFYIVPLAAIAFSKLVFGDNLLPFVLFQTAFHAVALVYLFLAASKLFQSDKAGFIAVLIMLLWIDIIHWNFTVMTESIFCSLACIALYSIAIFQGRTRDIITVVLLMVLLVLCRPTGVVIILGMLVFIVSYYKHLWKSNWYLSAGILVILLMIAGGAAYKMFSIWDFMPQHEKGNIITYADVVEGSSLDHKFLRIISEDLKLPNPELHPLLKMIAFIWYNPLIFLKAFAMKVFYLLSAVRPYYSIHHNIFSIVWMSGLYLASLFSLKSSFNRPVVAAIGSIVVVNCMLVGFSTVDWDNRFFVPMAPGIAMLAGGGIIGVFRNVVGNSDKNLQ